MLRVLNSHERNRVVAREGKGYAHRLRLLKVVDSVIYLFLLSGDTTATKLLVPMRDLMGCIYLPDRASYTLHHVSVSEIAFEFEVQRTRERKTRGIVECKTRAGST